MNAPAPPLVVRVSRAHSAANRHKLRRFEDGTVSNSKYGRLFGSRRSAGLAYHLSVSILENRNESLPCQIISHVRHPLPASRRPPRPKRPAPIITYHPTHFAHAWKLRAKTGFGIKRMRGGDPGNTCPSYLTTPCADVCYWVVSSHQLDDLNLLVCKTRDPVRLTEVLMGDGPVSVRLYVRRLISVSSAAIIAITALTLPSITPDSFTLVRACAYPLRVGLHRTVSIHLNTSSDPLDEFLRSANVP